MKKKQHYVWKHYLKQWSQNKQIWCKRNDKIIQTSLENIAQERYFYEVEKLTEEELKIIHSYIQKAHPTSYNTLVDSLDIYIEASLSNQKQYLENYHAYIESSALPFFEYLYEDNLTFLKTQKNKDNLSYFLGLQYTRTKKIRNSLNEMYINLLAEFDIFNKNDVNPKNLAKAISFLTSDFIGNWISDKHFNILEINSEKRFLTSDQPIINHLFSSSNSQAMELFYPLSPQKALLISESKFGKINIEDNVIQYFNNKLIGESEEKIFAFCENDLN